MAIRMLWEPMKPGRPGALNVSLMAGTLLGLMNQGPALMRMPFPPEALMRIFMNYLVPLSVAMYTQQPSLRQQSTQESFTTEGQYR